LVCVLFNANVFAASKVYVNTEQNIIFTAENLAATIPEFVQDEAKQKKMVETYQKLMNPENGAVSVENLLAVCRDGGFNTYRQAGFDQCRAFVQKLLENAEQEIEEGFLSGFCPAAYDENGKQQNGLRSIDENTRIGDFCSSTNIAGGEVVFRKGYNCTCAAYACNPGFQSEKGACVTEYKDSNGYCLRKEYTTNENLSKEGAALKFCESKSINGCKIKNALKNYPTPGHVVCNGTPEELVAVKQSMADREEQKIANMKYYEVCGKDKGKTGKKEYCIKDFFNWTNTQPEQAIGFAQDYAKMKNGHTVFCSNKTRKEGNDDYVKCAMKDASVFYEFKFDDIRESIDKDRRITERSAICRLAGGDVRLLDGENYRCKGISSASVCTTKLKPLAQRYGHDVEWVNGNCEFTLDHAINGGRMTDEEFEKSLAKIDGLDNRAFFKSEMIAIRKNFVLTDEIKKYVKSNIPNAKTITCNPGYETVHHGGWFAGQFTSDDVKRCFVDGKPIDFVFQDLSEIMGYERDAGEAGAKCVGNAGKYDGHYCRGLTKQECFDLEKAMLEELKVHGWAGDDDLVDWDEKAGACELNSSQFANNVNKTGKYTAIVGLTITGAFTGGTSTALAIGLMATELAGVAGEIYTERKKELLPQQWADEFLAQSRKCSSSSCAETTLRSNFGKISQVSDMLNGDMLKQVDSELARLAEYLPDERFEEILGSADAPSCWETWECQEKIFMVMQMASLVTAVGKGLVNFSRVIAKKAGKAAAETSTAIVKVSSNADNAIDVVKGAKAADGAADASKTANAGARAADGVGDAGRVANSGSGGIHPDLAAARSNPSAAKKLLMKYHPDKFSKYGDEVFEKARNVYKEHGDITKLSEEQLLELSREMRELDEIVAAAEASKVAGAAKAADNVADASKAANTGAKAADGAADAGKAANSAGKAADGAADASKAANKADDALRMSAKSAENKTLAQLKKDVAGDYFDDWVKDAKQGKVTPAFRASSTTDEGWALINKSLVSDNIQLVDDGNGFKIFVRTNNIDDVVKNSARSAAGEARRAEETVRKAAEADKLFNAKFPGFRNYGEGFRVSNQRFSNAVAHSKANEIAREGYFTKIVPTKGVSTGEEYVIVAIKQEDAAQFVWDGNNLMKNIDNSAFLRNVNNYMEKEITKIGNTSVFIEDAGSIGGRGIVVVRVGEKKIPFYVSTGTAGKTDVPTGKWEVFWGIGKDGWFNKGGIKDILNHYGSSELRQIANALDTKLGDPRNTQLVLETIGRNSQGGVGIVGRADLGSISENVVNSGFKSAPGTASNSWRMIENWRDVTDYLKGLH